MQELETEQGTIDQATSRSSVFKKIRGGILFAVGWMLSPLCWWNDLIFNLPVSYGVGYLFSRISEDWLLPGTIAGYWLSNLVGILMMQVGAIEVLQNQERNLKKDLFWGVVSSSAFTGIALVLVQFQIIEIPTSLTGGTFDLASLFPIIKGE